MKPKATDKGENEKTITTLLSHVQEIFYKRKEYNQELHLAEPKLIEKVLEKATLNPISDTGDSNYSEALQKLIEFIN